VLDLTPENREDFLITMKTLKDNTATVFTKDGGFEVAEEEELVGKLLKKARKTSKCTTDDMRLQFIKHAEGKHPKSLDNMSQAVLSAENEYQKILDNLAKYGMKAVPIKAGNSGTDGGGKGANPRFHTTGQRQPEIREQSRPESRKKDYSRACNACGREGHKAGRETCYLVAQKHPDINKDWGTKSFEKSDKGRAWIAKGIPDIPAGLKLNGERWEPEISFRKWKKEKAPNTGDTGNSSKNNKKGNKITPNHNCHLLDETESSPVSEAHTLHCGIITPQKKSYVNVLIDTGALQGNYLSADVAQWLQHQGVEEFIEKIKVCSFKGCETVNSYFLVDFSFLDKISGKIIIIEKIKTWLLPNCPYDIILGRKTLENFDLLGRINLSDKKYSQKFNFDLNKNETDISAQKAQSKTLCEKIRLDHKKMKDWEFCVGSARPTS